jgi:hypothetical protein
MLIPTDVRYVGSPVKGQLPSAFELQGYRFVLEVVYGLEVQLLPLVLWPPRFGVKIAVMIARDDDLLSVGQRSHPIDLGLDLLHRAGVRHVPRVYEQITIWDIWCICVRVGDADNSDVGFVAGRLERWSPEGEKDKVDQRYQSSKRGVEKAVEPCWRIPGVRSARPRPATMSGSELMGHVSS